MSFRGMILTALVITSAAAFILSGRAKKKEMALWDAAFIAAFWNLFDTGWWFRYDWSAQPEPDMLSPAYMISAIPFIIIFLAYIKRRGIDIGPSFNALFLKFPAPPSKAGEFKYLALFTIAAIFFVIPIAYAMNFIAWTPDLRYERMPLRLIEYILFVGLTEELVFRGAIQNLLTNSFKFRYGKAAALLLANILFALMWTHAAVPEPVNWDYIVMAFILGLFYAGVYTRSGNLWTAAILHGFVDFLWITFFAGQG